MGYTDERIWTQKGETFSNVSAEKEFGITHENIIDDIRTGKLQYREGSMHGNPWFRLLRHEVEALVIEIYGDKYLNEKKLQNELTQIEKDMKKLKKQCVLLEKRKIQILSMCNK